MLQIAKIYHNEKLINHKPLPYVSYHMVGDVIENDVRRLPTLIVGWKLVNKMMPLYPHDILEREVKLQRSNKYYWEFSPTEDIVQYTTGLEMFLKKVPYLYLQSFTYKNVDPFFNNIQSPVDITAFFPSGGSLYVYKNESAYYLHEKIIYGLKLSIFDYMNVDSMEITQALVAKSKSHLLDDSTQYQNYYKLFPEFGLLKRSMVVFLFS